MVIGERIRQRRLELGYTQDELARKVGYKGKVAICKIESGQRNVRQDLIVKLAEALEVTPSWLMGWDDEPVKMELSSIEEAMVKSYRIASPDTQSAALAVLGIKKEGKLSALRKA